MEAFAGAIVEQNGVTNRIPNRGKLHCSRTAEREVETARSAMPFENVLIELKCSDYEVLSLANRAFHKGT